MDIDNMKNVRIDKEEFIKQNNEKIRKSGHYAEVTILVEKGNGCIIPYIKTNKVGIREVALMIKSLESTLDQIKDKFPEANLLAQLGLSTRIEDL